MRTLLAWHIYAGVLGPILVLLHTGHRFESTLGVALTAMVLIVVLSGFVGRYLMSKIGREIKDKRALLDTANVEYERALKELPEHPEEISLARSLRSATARLFFQTEGNADTPLPAGVRAVRLAESVADLEFAVRTHEAFKSAFATWLKIHIALSVALYALLGVHVWAALYFGIRWFK